jgi:putative transposase
VSNLRRYAPEGRPVFVTLVTHSRLPIFVENSALLISAYRRIHCEGVRAVAWVVLPEHMHAILELGPMTLSDAMRVFKAKFSGLYRSRYGLTEGLLWQHRFWDHIIRDHDDFRQHLDYIHYNPVKHGLVVSPYEHVVSSLRQWERRGYYDQSWGLSGVLDFKDE